MGKVIAAIVVIALIIAAFVFFDFDGDVEGGSMPEVDVEGGSLPEVDMDVEGPDVSIEEEVVTVPTIDIDGPDEAEAEVPGIELEDEDEPQ